jgi:hypothetical protein
MVSEMRDQYLQLKVAPTAPKPRVGNAKPGLDPMIGQAHREEDRKMSGYDVNNLEAELSLPYFTITRGGGYFFLPSMTALEAIVGGRSPRSSNISPLTSNILRPRRPRTTSYRQ